MRKQSSYHQLSSRPLVAWSVEEETHGDTTDKTSDWNGHDPGEEQETNTLPVDGLEGTVHQTNTNGSTSNAHGCRDWKLVLGEDENGDGSSHLHGGTTRWRVVGDLVAHDC